MMKGAVSDVVTTGFQMRNDDAYHAYIVYGNILSYQKNEVGKIAEVPDEELVLYAVYHRRKAACWLVRTDSNSGSSIVPGILSPVELYCSVRGRIKVNRVIEAIKYYHKNKTAIADNSCFLTRLEAVIKSRVFHLDNIKDLHQRCNGYSL